MTLRVWVAFMVVMGFSVGLSLALVGDEFHRGFALGYIAAIVGWNAGKAFRDWVQA